MQEYWILKLFKHFKLHKGPPSEVLISLDIDIPEEETDEKEKEEEVKESDFCGEFGEEGGPLVQEEEQETGTVKLHVYKSYWNAVGACLSPLILLSLFLMQGNC